MDKLVNVLCIVQARLSSSRLPNKVLMTLGESGLSILEHVYNRLSKSQYIDRIVFAIPDTPANDLLAEFMDEKTIPYTRGSENDVLERFYKCAIQYNPKLLIRATCDNPLVDWVLCDKLIEHFNNGQYIVCKDTPLGTGVEVFTMNALKEAYENATTEVQHEHVTPYIYQKMEGKYMEYNGLHYRLTVDEERDFHVMNELYLALYKGEPVLNDIAYAYLAKHPDLASFNQQVHQKQLGE